MGVAQRRNDCRDVPRRDALHFQFAREAIEDPIRLARALRVLRRFHVKTDQALDVELLVAHRHHILNWQANPDCLPISSGPSNARVAQTGQAPLSRTQSA